MLRYINPMIFKIYLSLLTWDLIGPWQRGYYWITRYVSCTMRTLLGLDYSCVIIQAITHPVITKLLYN